MNNFERSNPNPNRLNIYTCTQCGLHIVTKDVDAGTTPMLTNCRCTVGCQGMMQSSFYRVFDPDGIMRWTHEWYSPTVLLNMSPAVIEHVRKGGLLLRRRIDNPQANDVATFTHIHLARQTKYRVIGDVRLQISRPELFEVSNLDAESELKRLDGMKFTLYQGEDGEYSARHPDEFNDGRFQPIENVS